MELLRYVRPYQDLLQAVIHKTPHAILRFETFLQEFHNFLVLDKSLARTVHTIPSWSYDYFKPARDRRNVSCVSISFESISDMWFASILGF